MHIRHGHNLSTPHFPHAKRNKAGQTVLIAVITVLVCFAFTGCGITIGGGTGVSATENGRAGISATEASVETTTEAPTELSDMDKIRKRNVTLMEPQEDVPDLYTEIEDRGILALPFTDFST